MRGNIYNSRNYKGLLFPCIVILCKKDAVCLCKKCRKKVFHKTIIPFKHNYNILRLKFAILLYYYKLAVFILSVTEFFYFTRIAHFENIYTVILIKHF